MRKKVLILILLAPFLSGMVRTDGVKAGKPGDAGYIDITVESNVNRLYFKYDLEGMCLTLKNVLKTAYANDTSFSAIRVPVKEFRSTNQMAYRDFLELVRSEEYPNQEIVIPDNHVYPYDSGSEVKLNGVAVKVAGVTRFYNINCKIEGTNENSRLLTGTIRIKLTDFDIEPPVKWAGLVRVRNEIIVKFGLCIRNSPEVRVKA